MTDTTTAAAAERIQTPYLVPEDELDRSLRPAAAGGVRRPGARCASSWRSRSRRPRARGDALDHVLLAGPPGLGKTSLAQIVAAELDAPFVQTAGPALERKGDIAAFLTALEPRSVFFVDEIHRLPRTLEETFYPAMEDHRLPITVGQGAGARVVTLELPPFTLVGATTAHGSADHAAARPLRHPGAAGALRDRRARGDRQALGGDPRDRARRGRRAGDRGTQPGYAARGQPAAQARARLRRGAHGRESSRAAAAHAALELLEVDELGLDRLDREILRAICVKFDGGPVGLSTLAVAVGEEQDTIEDVYEPYLLMQGLIKRTPRGRAATPAAFAHLGIPAPEPAGRALF